MKLTVFERMLKTPQFRAAPPQDQLELMLKYKAFDELLDEGYVYDIERAREKLGYSGWGLRRICRRAKIGHIERMGQYYFLRSQIRAAFTFVQARA